MMPDPVVGGCGHNDAMLLADIVETSAILAATRSRTAKVAALAACLRAADPAELPLVVSFLSGTLPQRRTGLGWRGVSEVPDPAASPTLTVLETDAAFESLAGLSGPGSRAARTELVTALFARATEHEQAWLRGVVAGGVRQGALEALVGEALALAAGLPAALVRRAAMLAGGLAPVAVPAMTEGEPGLARFTLTVGIPVQPMLAASAADLGAALERVGGGELAVEAKLDGIRIQAHKRGDQVLLTTRSLDDITARLPEVVEVVRSLPADRLILDGEAIALAESGRPLPFQDTASRTARSSGAVVTPYFFDLLHHDGRDLLDAPARERGALLDRIVPEDHRVARIIPDSTEVAAEFLRDTLARGHEGVVVKSLTAPYAAGRRGSAWVKVKPVHTVDLVVLAAEWGSGRRRGWLSNIHLGARGPDGFVMLGKTFKGMTDQMLAWQTERFLALETHRTGHVVHLRPEQVVEIAFDGVQTSTRYPGGVALRFARVLRYRDDKTPEQADSITDLQRLR